jgi:pimeloyl-ACP methyl ester carboxylesterase
VKGVGILPASPSPSPELTYACLDVQVDGVDLRVATAERAGERTGVVFLHGFGSTKEDFADTAGHHGFAGRPVLAYDAPGHGRTSCPDPAKISIPFLVRTALQVLSGRAVERFHLVGHSMGGLTGLMLALEIPERIVSFVDIEGNLAPEDCFLSRQILTYHDGDDDAFLDAFAERARRSSDLSSALYAASLQHKVSSAAVRGILSSMVDLSDHDDLLGKFLALPFPRMFVHGDRNSSLTYLPTLAANGIESAEIPHSGHWPMYANPAALWERITDFQDRVDARE